MSKKLTFLLVLNGFLLFSSCKGQKNTTAENIKGFPGMELIMEENYSGSEVEETLIIKDQKSLVDFFGKINRTRKPGLPIPEVNFTRETLFIWCAGAEVTEMPELYLAQETKDAYILSKDQKNNKTETKTVTSPFRIYKLPNNSKHIRFESSGNR